MSAITIDFKKPLLFLDGKPINEIKQKSDDPDVPVMINTTLGTNLAQSQSGGMKSFYWAITLYKEGVLVLDKTDRDALKKSVQDMSLSNLVKGRIVEVIEQAEEAAKPKDGATQ